MKKLYFLISFFSILSFFSCNNGDWKVYADYSAKILDVKKNAVVEKGNELILTYEFEKPTTISTEYLSSIALISFSDTAISKIQNKHIEKFTICILQNGVNDTFSYLTKDLVNYKKALEISSFFVNNFIARRSIENKSIVDLKLISEENLSELDQISIQLSESSPIKAYTFDGFKINKEDPNVLQIRIQIHTEKESVVSSVQYNLAKSQIFYFGINDEL